MTSYYRYSFFPQDKPESDINIITTEVPGGEWDMYWLEKVYSTLFWIHRAEPTAYYECA